MDTAEKGVTVVSEHAIGAAPADGWYHVRVAARGTRLTLTVDGATAAEYDVPELAGVIAFTAHRGHGYVKNIQLVSSPWAASAAAPMSSDDVEKAGGRPSRPLVEVRPDYTRARDAGEDPGGSS